MMEDENMKNITKRSFLLLTICIFMLLTFAGCGGRTVVKSDANLTVKFDSSNITIYSDQFCWVQVTVTIKEADNIHYIVKERSLPAKSTEEFTLKKFIIDFPNYSEPEIINVTCGEPYDYEPSQFVPIISTLFICLIMGAFIFVLIIGCINGWFS